MYIRTNNGNIDLISSEQIENAVEYTGDLPKDFNEMVGFGKYQFRDNAIQQTPNWIMPDQPDSFMLAFDNSMSILLTTPNRTVQVYNVKINYNDKIIKFFSRCVYSDGKEPKYIEFTITNDNIVSDGKGGTIGEYDFVLPKIGIKTYLTTKYKEINP